MAFDQATLFTVATGITGLLGVFLLVLWIQERSVRALGFWGAAYLMGASAVTLWGTKGALVTLPPEVPNALLFVACGMIWNGARLFHGRTLKSGGLFAGAAFWFAVMNDPLIAESEHARVVLSSLVIAIYAFLTAYELRRERRRALAVCWLNVAIPMLHGAVFMAPTALILLVPAPAPLDDLFALFAFETMIYVVGTAFIVVVMAKDSVVLIHKTAAMTDLLTGLFNRRAFLDAADHMIAERARKSQPVSVLLFDLDYFKSINDRFGHAVGDNTIKLFAKTARANMRTTDVISRLGGEEFAAIMSCNTTEAVVVAERLRVAFEAAGVIISGHEMNATVSIGLATAPAPVSIDAILARADGALYRAKHNGRNRIEVADYERRPTLLPEPAPPRAEPAVAMP